MKDTYRLFKYLRKTILRRNYSKENTNKNGVAPELPPCDYKPKPYQGPEYEDVQKIREDHVVPCIKPYYKKPLLIHEGHMQWLFDHKGKRYLDMFSGIVTISVGHCHPKVNEAAMTQMKKLWHTTNIYQTPRLYEYAERLTSKLPGELKVVYFVNSGSEANDMALLLARVYTGHHDVISLRGAYHGMSPTTMGITAMSTMRYEMPVSHGIHHAMNPDVYRGLWGGCKCRDSPVQTQRECDCESGDKCKAATMYYEQLEEVFKYSLPRGRVAAFFAESIQGIGGTIQFPKGYLKKAYELIRANGGLCVADEVQTGFGRTGDHFWGFEMHGVIPDIVTMAKGMGNGYPIAAVITTPKIAEALGRSFHFNTYGGNPIACTVGMTTLQVIEEEGLQNNSAVVGTYMLEKLSSLRDEFQIVGDVRGKGLMGGIDLVVNKESRQPLPAKPFADIWEDCKDMGLLIGKGGLHGNVLRVKPPLIITKQDVDFTVEVLRKALNNYNKKCYKDK